MILTQTNWLKMPTRELGNSSEFPNGSRNVGTTLLKKHKILPHPHEPFKAEQFYRSSYSSKPRDLVIDTGVPSIPGSDSSSPRILKHTSRRIGSLPPTPPTHSRQSSGNQAGITSAPRSDSASNNASVKAQSIPRTPPSQQSPPTPDVTPPRTRTTQLTRPPARELYTSASSRTDSFKTALENLDSDDDEVATVRPDLISARQSQLSVSRNNHIKRKEVGLGLGLHFDSDGTATPKPEARLEQEFVVFDGDWGVIDAVEVEREWDDNLMRNVTVRKRPGRNMSPYGAAPRPEVLEDDLVAPTAATRVVRSLPLQERIARHRLERDAANRESTERFAQKIDWPSSVADPESPVTPQEGRRFSSISTRSVSGASTIVEAIVVDAPPTRAKTLRHSKKISGLRDISGLSTVSVAASEPQLHHTRGRIPERRHTSLISETPPIANTSSKSRRQIVKNGGIPVVIIPARRSSTRSSGEPSLRSTSSRKSKRTNSLTSAPLSASSKYNEVGYFDSHPARKRAMSESESSSVRTIDFPPEIPTRSSSLSAPTSRNNSRAPSLAAAESRNVSRSGSLTAESLKAHNMMEARKQPHPLPAPPTPSQHSDTNRHHLNHHHHPQMKVDHNGDPFFGSRLSTQATPFSQYSYETAGTMAELSEAQAVEIFPHQNKSVLVVQHQTSSSEPSPVSLKPLDTSVGPPTMALNGTATEGNNTPPQTGHPMDEVDSPLRNPREPPLPPAIKFIPPTPAGMTPGHEEERQLGYDPEERNEAADNAPKRGGSLMRRAFSNSRRNSEINQPGVGFLKRTFSLSNNKRKDQLDEPLKAQEGGTKASLYPNEDETPAEGDKLHPFWRPAYFWEDPMDDESWSDEEYGGRFPMFDNRPKPKRALSEKLKRTFAILPLDEDRQSPEHHAVDRRYMRRSPSGNNLRVVKQRSKATLRRDASRALAEARRSASEGNESRFPRQHQVEQFGYGFKEGNGGHRGYTIPGLGLRVEYVGWEGLKRRISEKKREQRSQKLRESIGAPSEVRSGVDDVLRRRDNEATT